MADIFTTIFSKHIFLYDNSCILVQSSFTFVPKGLINNKLTLDEIMTSRLRGDKPLSQPMFTWSTDAHMRYKTSMSLREAKYDNNNSHNIPVIRGLYNAIYKFLPPRRNTCIFYAIFVMYVYTHTHTRYMYIYIYIEFIVSISKR